MVTQMINKTADTQFKKDLLSLQFINRAATGTQQTKLKKDLLSHLNRHPHAKFTAGAIPHNISRVRKVDLDEALEGLVTDELIERHTNQQGQLFYCLNTDPMKRESVLRLTARNGNGKGRCTTASTLGGGQQISTQVIQLKFLEEIASIV